MNGPDSPYWTPDAKTSHIFLHPTLRYLHLSCVNLRDDFLEPHGLTYYNSFGVCFVDDQMKDFDNTHQTPLTHLVLEECNISHRGLRKVLSLPKRLESLYLGKFKCSRADFSAQILIIKRAGENVHNIRHFAQAVDPACNHLFERDPGAIIAALAQQRDSLKELTYVTNEAYHRRLHLVHGYFSPYESTLDGRFAEFKSLEKVTLVGQCSNFERALMSSKSPPTLHTLHFKGADPFHGIDFEPTPLLASTDQVGFRSGIPFLRAPSSSLPPPLKELNLTYDKFVRSVGMEKSLIAAAAKEIKKLEFALRVAFQTSTRYYPPYLYGESEPRQELLYVDGTFVGRFAGDLQAGSSSDTDSEWVSDDVDGTDDYEGEVD